MRWHYLLLVAAAAMLATVSVITLASRGRSEKAPPQSVQILVRGANLALPLEGVIDFAVERARLEKGISQEQKEIGKIDAKLGNADFLRRAPEEVVEEQQERRELAVARVEKMQAALKLLA